MRPLSAKSEVYISYKIGEPRSMALRDAMTEILQKEPYSLKVVTDVIHLGLMDDLEEFMTQLGKADYVVLILTKEFMLSENCMFELATMAQQGNFKDRVFPIVYEDALIKGLQDRLDRAWFWQEKLEALQKTVARFPKATESTKAELAKLEGIVSGTQDALNAIVQIRHLPLRSNEELDTKGIAEYIQHWTVKRGGSRRWKRLAIGAVLLAILGLVVGGLCWRHHNNVALKAHEAMIADSLRKDSILQMRLAVRADSLRRDSIIQRLIDDMEPVAGGTFQMGFNIVRMDSVDKNPIHAVTVSDFHLGRYEVTQSQWKAVMGNKDNPSQFKGDTKPVENVNWNEVQNFIQKLNGITQRRFRLPTEAEWEYAASIGGEHYEFAGSNDFEQVAWYWGNSGDSTHPVGKKAPNGFSLFDMSGNVWEWCEDFHDPYPKESVVNPTGALVSIYRVIRGGSWFQDILSCRVTYRGGAEPDTREPNLGFRLASE